MGRVVVLGSASQDLHLRVPRHPKPGETLLGSDLEYRFGGKGANQAVAAARAGAATTFLGRFGDDAAGGAYRDRLAGLGIDVTRTTLDPDAPTGLAVIYLDDAGENMIVVAPGANARLGAEALAGLADLTPADVLLLSLEVDLGLVADAVRLAAERGARVVCNLAPFAVLPTDALALADPVVVNEHEAAELRDSGVEPPSMLVTLGARGSRWGEIEVPAEAAEVVDTTGAGDAYCGTLAARLALGDERGTAMRAASAAAAVTVSHPGAQPPPA